MVKLLGCLGVNFIWNHVYGASGDGKHQWSQPGSYLHTGKSGLTELQPCVTFERTSLQCRYRGGTKDDPDGDLHFTLALDDKQKQYSNEETPHAHLRIIYQIAFITDADW